MAQARSEGWGDRLRPALRQIGPLRLVGTALFLILALLCARYSWHVPLLSDAERAFYDTRFLKSAQRVGQYDGIVLVTYNDETLELLQKRSPLDRKMLADALAALDRMEVKAIGVDILIDSPQAEDPQLVETLRGMRTPTFLGFASSAEGQNEDQIAYRQEQFLKSFIRQVRTQSVRPASVKAEPDAADGVIRRWPRPDPTLPPRLPAAMAPANSGLSHYDRSIDYLLPSDSNTPIFTALPIEVLVEMPEALTDVVRGRYVLIGANINATDDVETPASRETKRWTKGVEVLAQMLAQVLDGRLRPQVPSWAVWLLALAVVGAGAATSLFELRNWKLGLAVGTQLAAFGALPFLLQGQGFDTLGLPAFGLAPGWVLAFVAVGTAARAVGSEQRRFAQSTLGKYLPADVAAEILKDPDRLSLRGERRPIYALFTDMEGFTKLSHAIEPERLSTLLNTYLDVLSEAVLSHGGTIDKFVGDAVVAFWGAPIAREDDADRAIRAAVAMFQAGEAFRESAGADVPKIGCTRVGLHHGDAVIGNFGGEGRIQYTALGDGMNTAARLESANKSLHSTILVSREAKERSSLDIFRPLGRIVLSGRATPVEVWEPVPAMPPERRARLTELWLAFDGGDAAALDALDALAANGGDAALESFVYRLRQSGPGGHFVLESK